MTTHDSVKRGEPVNVELLMVHPWPAEMGLLCMQCGKPGAIPLYCQPCIERHQRGCGDCGGRDA